jgi:DNA-directed RNA polymerase specialized sigma24 family protein
MDRLYLLSYLLTANEELAEKCFVQGLQDARNGNRVFRDWAESWARRTVIMNAIRAVRPSAQAVTKHSGNVRGEFLAEVPQGNAIVALPDFERFVYVVTVLEGYSDRECALLFGCTRDAVVAARVRVLQALGSEEGMQTQLKAVDAAKPLRRIRSLNFCTPLSASA